LVRNECEPEGQKKSPLKEDGHGLRVKQKIEKMWSHEKPP